MTSVARGQGKLSASNGPFACISNFLVVSFSPSLLSSPGKNRKEEEIAGWSETEKSPLQ
jgi:hypothetical protein